RPSSRHLQVDEFTGARTEHLVHVGPRGVLREPDDVVGHRRDGQRQGDATGRATHGDRLAVRDAEAGGAGRGQPDHRAVRGAGEGRLAVLAAAVVEHELSGGEPRQGRSGGERYGRGPPSCRRGASTAWSGPAVTVRGAGAGAGTGAWAGCQPASSVSWAWTSSIVPQPRGTPISAARASRTRWSDRWWETSTWPKGRRRPSQLT